VVDLKVAHVTGVNPEGVESHATFQKSGHVSGDNHHRSVVTVEVGIWSLHRGPSLTAPSSRSTVKPVTSSTCATLAGVFPVLLLTVILEGRNVNTGIRARGWFVYVLSAALGFGFLGLVLAVLGVEADGLSFPAFVVLAWMSFAGIILTAFVFLLFLAASFEVETEKEVAQQEAAAKLRKTAIGRLRLALGAARKV
jgi:hypothetical protein